MAWWRSCEPTCGPTISTFRTTKLEVKKSCCNGLSTSAGATPRKLVDRVQNAAPLLVAEVVDLLGNSGVTLLGVRAQMQRVLLHQVLLQAGCAGVVQVLLAGSGLWLERIE